MSTRDELYLAHILEAIAAIERFTAGGREEFVANDMVQSAVIRQLEIVGEAVKKPERRADTARDGGAMEADRRRPRQTHSWLFPGRSLRGMGYGRARFTAAHEQRQSDPWTAVNPA